MNTTASFSILLLLCGVSQALFLKNFDDMLVTEPEHVDITKKILDSNNGSTELLIEGDLVFPKTRNAIYCFNNNCLWKKNSKNLVEVPYTVSREYTSNEKRTIENAMMTFNSKTCIRFVPRSSQTDYISIENNDGCYSLLGRTGGKQQVSLQRNSCVYNDLVQHELNHALGFEHEHARSDRDKYIRINWKFISPDMVDAFEKQNTNNLNTPYDYGSVMHYGRTAFTNQDGKETITPIPDASVEIGQTRGLSNIDIMKINKLYGCTI
ncbi:hatching enzyme 1.2-like [Triplophysa dalaica]|uniref:hatching enzyme 1.2-like n=1 Tax=Triplophysa dalaica TaxID=1582913 RepID=UPI0024DFDFE2|nr:hatching enzyme 1.2-like [Triplophysa dalaica]